MNSTIANYSAHRNKMALRQQKGFHSDMCLLQRNSVATLSLKLISKMIVYVLSWRTSLENLFCWLKGSVVCEYCFYLFCRVQISVKSSVPSINSKIHLFIGKSIRKSNKQMNKVKAVRLLPKSILIIAITVSICSRLVTYIR